MSCHLSFQVWSHSGKLGFSILIAVLSMKILILANVNGGNIKKSTDVHVANKTLKVFIDMVCVCSRYNMHSD